MPRRSRGPRWPGRRAPGRTRSRRSLEDPTGRKREREDDEWRGPGSVPADQVGGDDECRRRKSEESQNRRRSDGLQKRARMPTPLVELGCGAVVGRLRHRMSLGTHKTPPIVDLHLMTKRLPPVHSNRRRHVREMTLGRRVPRRSPGERHRARTTHGAPDSPRSVTPHSKGSPPAQRGTEVAAANVRPRCAGRATLPCVRARKACRARGLLHRARPRFRSRDRR